MATPTALEALLKRDRLVVVAVLLCVIVISWVYILAGAGIGVPAVEMTTMGRSAGLGGGDAADMLGVSMGQGEAGVMLPAAAPAVWTVDYTIPMFFMWWVMMLGMMLPSAAPMILLYTKVMRKEQEKGAPYWTAGLALFVMIEKLMPAGHRIGSLTGLALIVWGGVLPATEI